MAYILKEITIRTNNTDEGIRKIGELWLDITSGKLPILFDSDHNFIQGISPVSRYSNYASDETGDYDLSIMGVTADFFAKMEQKIAAGEYKKYDASDDNGDIATCTQKAWKKVWADSKSGKLKRSFICDYESSVPAEYAHRWKFDMLCFCMAISNQMWFFTYHFTAVPIILTLAALGIISVLLPVICYNKMCGESIVDRLRISE